MPRPLPDQKRVQTFLAIRSVTSLCAFLGIPQRKLTYILYALPEERRYREFSVRKLNGELRSIRAPIKPLKDLQRSLSGVLSAIHKPRVCVYGYVRGRGIRENAALHKNQRWILKIDLKDFFPSINFGRVRGIFLAAPFMFPLDVATVLAQITTFENELPQGAPTSPVISNQIGHRLDRILSELARKYRCFYSRYVDDIVMSTARRQFPSNLAALELTGDRPVTKIGDELRAAVQGQGFLINENKLALRGRNSRQLCTGLVVNQRPNVKRQYVRQIRSMLHVWRVHGLANAGRVFFDRIDRRNRPTRPTPEMFRFVVSGRIQFLGSVKGWDDPVYQGLAKRLASLYPQFERKAVIFPRAQIRVWAEGSSDYLHLQAALSHFQSKGLYTQIEMEGPQSENTRGSKQLLTMCQSYSESPQRQTCVFVFDRDEVDIIKEVLDPEKPFKTWGNRVFSFAIPIPDHRTGVPAVCIEMYYKDEDLTRSDQNGRRLFLRDEFDEEGVHRTTRQLVYRHPKKKTLIVDSDVVDTEQRKNVALPKADFATYVRGRSTPFDEIAFDAFASIFDVLVKIAEADAGSL
jgi:RNA-directed DNA polymerase